MIPSPGAYLQDVFWIDPPPLPPNPFRKFQFSFTLSFKIHVFCLLDPHPGMDIFWNHTLDEPSTILKSFQEKKNQREKEDWPTILFSTGDNRFEYLTSPPYLCPLTPSPPPHSLLLNTPARRDLLNKCSVKPC